MAEGRVSQRRVPTAVGVEVLGPLRLAVDGVPVDVRGAKRRAALGLLALAEGRTVAVDALVDALWPDDVPDSGRQALHSVVSRLRSDLGPAAVRLETGPAGYRLALAPDELDLTRARRLLTTARGLAGRDPAAAAALLREACDLWHGPVLPDLTVVPPIATAAQACASLRREVVDALVSAAVAAGAAEEVGGLAEAAVAEDPLREPAVLGLVRALAATGRAPAALRVAREFRARLAEETGLDPTPALAELERAVASGGAGPAPTRPAAIPAFPFPATSLLGRAPEVAALHGLLAAERLVTVVGPGGVGKTRLALEVARPVADATVLLLAPVTDAAAVPHALAGALGLTAVRGDVLATCLAVLGDRNGLLVVDNCEHLLGAARDLVAAVLAGCPRLAVLATSRERLGLAAEHAHRLAPLDLPAPGQDPAAAASVALFADRARRVRPVPPEQWDTVADVVRRLDGMPLAIELAAGRLSSLSLPDLRDRLDRALDLLGGGAGPSGDARHRTLRATVAWSYELLGPDEQRLFRHLSVFADGVDLPTAERLAADLGLSGDPGSLLAHLVDASVLDADLGDGTRYRMLETLRAFGRDRLAAAGEAADADERLLRWAGRLAAEAGTALGSADEPAADRVLRREVANLRAAWHLARGSGRLDATVALITPLYDAIAYRDLLELRTWAEDLAEDPALGRSPRAVLVLAAAAEAAYHRGDRATARRRAEAGLATPDVDEAGHWLCRCVLSVVALAAGAHGEATGHALAADRTAPRGRECLGLAALATAYGGDLDAARAWNDRGAADAVAPTMRSWAAYVAGEIDVLAGDGAAAEAQYLRAVDLARASGATFLVGVATVGLLTVRASSGRVPEALTGYREVVDYFARTGNWTHQWATLRDLARLLRRLGDEVAAGAIEAAADAAPDAPADGRPHATGPRPEVPPGRAAVLDLARRAIDEALTRR
ncbi:BTAD domain-containing putative transcriptional regulator [Trujillonella endophytica]|uniref:Predicted ATPase n=1 Tax=Trujillonella endophytica TaxID=673521 RepID=A0A1H8Q1A9_9ACTN|nr:BTAD domain-containing putative transcriptional regulator [Trujillella endophytica]SEO47707.1 Predicted ATPase [Trujillella endophytica]